MPNRRKRRASKPSRRNHTSARRPWTRYSDERLLDVRLCDLDLSIERSPLERCIRKLHEELARRNLRFRPHCWLAEEWFSPDGVPGIAIPFYLSHPRLMRLERRQMLQVEGGTTEWCMRLLRHEAGHAIDHAYLLHRKQAWQRRFGKSSKPYPTVYRPKPYSKHYVQHLDYWYAQSHPDEDFAETFAVWLRPRATWRRRYQGWPAIKKLEYLDGVMAEIADAPPKVTSRQRVEPISQIKKTLHQYYEEKQSQYELEYTDVFYEEDLRRLFSDAPEHARKESAAVFLRRIRKNVREQVARWTGEYQYTLDLVLREIIELCRELNLRVDRPERQLREDFCVFLTVQTMNYIHSGRHRMAM